MSSAHTYTHDRSLYTETLKSTKNHLKLIFGKVEAQKINTYKLAAFPYPNYKHTRQNFRGILKRKTFI